MPITPGTIADIRTAVASAILGDPNEQVEGESFRYTEEDMPTGWRTFTVLFDMDTFAWKRVGDAAHGGSGSSWNVDMKIRIGYHGRSRVDYEDAASEDAVQLLHALHPAPTVHACVISFLDETRTDVIARAEDGGPICEHTFKINFLHAYP